MWDDAVFASGASAKGDFGPRIEVMWICLTGGDAIFARCVIRRRAALREQRDR